MTSSHPPRAISTETILQAVSEVLSQLVELKSPQSLFQQLLQTLMTITDSPFGVLWTAPTGSQAHGATEYRAQTAGGRSESPSPLIGHPAAETIDERALQHALRRTLTSGDPYLPTSDDLNGLRTVAADDPRAIQGFLGLPFQHGADQLGMIAVANAAEGYCEEQLEELAPLLKACAAVLLQLRQDQQRVSDEFRLQQSEEKLRTIINNIPGTSYRCLWSNGAWYIEYVSDAAEQVTGYPADYFRGQNLESYLQIVHPDDRQMIEEYLMNVIQNHQAPPIENRLIRPDGTTSWVHSRSQVILDEHGEARYLDGVLLDVTDRKLAEASLSEANAFNAAVINAASRVALIATDCLGKITLFNAGAQRLLGYGEREAVQHLNMTDLVCPEQLENRGRELNELYGAHPQGFEVLSTAPLRFGSEDREWVLVTRDGRSLQTRVVTTGIRDEHQSLSGYLLIAVDITEQKRTVAELISARQAAETANQLKSQFLANMSHEIRTPMTAILGYTELLARRITSSFESEALSTIKRNSDHLIQLINDLLDLSKIESGNLTLERVPCCLQDIAQNVVRLLQVNASERDNVLSLEVADELPPQIIGDPTRLRQLLLNLAGNAVKFTEHGTVTVRLLLTDSEPAELLMEFADTGIGMTAEQLKTIFRPFVQADSSTTRKYGGTGLGLAICKRLVELLEGRIETQSTPGQGTTFRVWLPLRLPDPAEVASAPTHRWDETSLPIRITRSIDAQDALAGAHILLADDALVNQRLIQHRLNSAGADVIVVGDGQQAIELVEQMQHGPTPFDLILMDMQMPVMDGFEAVEILRSRGCETPIIALTANAMAGDRERCLGVGCNDYVAKPINWDLLLLTLSELLESRTDGGGTD